MTWAIGVDIGGTFADCVGVDPEGRLHHAKAISTHDGDVSQGVVDAPATLAQRVGPTGSRGWRARRWHCASGRCRRQRPELDRPPRADLPSGLWPMCRAQWMISDLSCPTAGTSAAVIQAGDVITSADPTGGSSAWTLTPPHTPARWMALPAPHHRCASSGPKPGTCWRRARQRAGSPGPSSRSSDRHGLLRESNHGRLATRGELKMPAAPERGASVGTGVSLQLWPVRVPSLCIALDRAAGVRTSATPSCQARLAVTQRYRARPAAA